MLSKSSVSKSSSPSSTCSMKNDVGGICLGSPTITASLPLAITPIALHVGSCEASSNTTMSNIPHLSGSKNCAHDRGLMSTHGQSFKMSSPICVKSVLIETPLPPALIACCRIPNAEDTFASLLRSGRFLAIFR